MIQCRRWDEKFSSRCFQSRRKAGKTLLDPGRKAGVPEALLLTTGAILTLCDTWKEYRHGL